MKCRRKPLEIEAVQYVEYGKLVKGMCNSQSCFGAGNSEPHVHTAHANQIVNLEIGDFVIPEMDGEHYYPCKPDVFVKTYEPVLVKHRVFPMQMIESDYENWLTHPEIVKGRLRRVISETHPTWKCTRIRLDPGLKGLAFEGKPFLGEHQNLMLLENLVFALVDVPDNEPEELFVTSTETGFPITGL